MPSSPGAFSQDLGLFLINPGILPREAKPSFNTISIREREFAGKEAKDTFDNQAVFVICAAREGLSGDEKITRLEREMPIQFECRTCADPSIHQLRDSASDADGSEHGQINFFPHRHG